MKKYILYLFITCFTLQGFAQNTSVFEKGNQLYKEGKYADAITEYNKIVNSSEHSSDLYYNLANAHYKLSNIAESIYNYEKALSLNSNNQDAKNNLIFANKMKIDAIDVIPETGFTKFMNSLINKLSFEGWSFVAIFFTFLSVIAFIVYFKAFSSAKKRISFLLFVLGLLSMFVSLSFAYQQEQNTLNTKFAIIFAKESKATTEPNTKSDQAFILHEGTKVKVIEIIDDYHKIKLTNGSVGFVKRKDLKVI